MFFQENGGLKADTQTIAENIKLADISLKNFAQSLKNSVTDVQKVINQAAAINSQTANQVRQTLGQTRVVSNQVQDVIAQATKSTGLIGINAEKNIELFGALNTAMQRNTFFTDQQITRFQALGFTANMTAQQLADMATSFDTLGYTTDETLVMMEGMTKEARSYGLNVSQFMDQVNKNLKLMVGYNFKGGVDGLSKMVAQAQALRIDMGATKSFAEKLLDPAQAIETAAGFQMLGGAVGDLGNPFRLLNMAQTDMAGLQDELVKMSAASIQFNEETGEFDIPVTQMYRMREAANLAGRSYEEFSEMAMNAAQRTQKLKLLDEFNVPEEQKELIASLGKIGANGNLEITMPDGSIKKIGQGFNELVGDDYAELQKMLDVNKMSELDVAKTSMGYLDEIKNAQDTLVKLTTLNLIQSGGFETFGENISKAQDLLTTSFLKRESEINLPPSAVNAVGTVTTQLKLEPEDADNFVGAMVDGLNTFSKTIEDKFIPALENFDFNKNIIEPMTKGWESVSDAIRDTGWLEIDNGNVIIRNVNAGQRELLSGESATAGQRELLSSESATAGQRELINNMSSASINTIENATINNMNGAPTGGSSEPIQLAVSGDINLSLENILTNASIDNDVLGRALANNQQFIADLEKEMNNSLNSYNYRSNSNSRVS